jgi:tetratricopeptide (TPR) repeat protein
MDNYSKLADHFAGKHDAKTALYFRSKAADVARLTDDPLEEPTALLALGETELAEHQSHKAVRTLEGCLDLVSEHLRAASMTPKLRAGLEAAKAKSQALLLAAYSAASKALTEDGDLAGALAAELRALQVSQEAGNKHSEAGAQVRAGRLCLKLGKPNKAMPYLQNFMALYEEAEREGDRLEGSDDAFAGMAEAFEMAGRPKEALQALSKYAEASDRAGDSHSVAEARQRLGEARLRRGEHGEAVNALEQAYSVRRALLAAGTAERGDLAAARVSLGLAIAAGRTDGLLRAVAGDVQGLLAWKTARNDAALEEPAAQVEPVPEAAAATAGSAE